MTTKATRDRTEKALTQLARLGRTHAGDLRAAGRRRDAEGYDEAVSLILSMAEWMRVSGLPPLVQPKLWG